MKLRLLLFDLHVLSPIEINCQDAAKLSIALDEIELRQIDRFLMNPGVRAGIEAVKSMNLKIAVTTELGKKVACAFLEKHGLKDIEILPRVEIGENLQDHLLAGLKQMKIEPDEIIFFCNRLSDLRGAKSLGLRVVVLPNKNERIDRLLLERPNGMIMSLGELPDLLSLEAYRISEGERKNEAPTPEMVSQTILPE
jgi:beta-phosphoglucomutase-like phosphatase (HAD superfamily)